MHTRTALAPQYFRVQMSLPDDMGAPLLCGEMLADFSDDQPEREAGGERETSASNVSS